MSIFTPKICWALYLANFWGVLQVHVSQSERTLRCVPQKICYWGGEKLKVARAFYFGDQGWQGVPIGSPQMWNIPGLSWGKLGKILPIWMAFSAQMMIVTAGLIPSKNHLMPLQ
jgi:hypothetical protein